MLKLFGETKIDFVRYHDAGDRRFGFDQRAGDLSPGIASGGTEMFDTDFTGGTVVHIVLEKSPMTDADVRKLVDSRTQNCPISRCKPSPGAQAAQSLQYIIRTSNENTDKSKKSGGALRGSVANLLRGSSPEFIGSNRRPQGRRNPLGNPPAKTGDSQGDREVRTGPKAGDRYQVEWRRIPRGPQVSLRPASCDQV